MLKGIPGIISPELIKIMMEMGHGDELVLADANFPAASTAKRLIRCDGINACDLLDAILELFPLDTYSEHQVCIMQKVPGDTVPTPIWGEFEKIVKKHEPVHNRFVNIDRFEFYERAKQAYAVIATGEKALYANIIIKKGVI